MKKLIALAISLIILTGCSSLPFKVVKKKKGSDITEMKKGFSINWDTKYEIPEHEEGYFIIINPKTNKKFKITFKDFLIMKKAYKNWRVVEASRPVITNIEQKDEKIYVTFNYIEKGNKSILSGKFIVDLKYIKKPKDEKTKMYLKGALVGSSAANLLFIILLVLL